jgi:hypothetical protein
MRQILEQESKTVRCKPHEIPGRKHNSELGKKTCIKGDKRGERGSRSERKKKYTFGTTRLGM